jgi:FRG domain
MNGYWVGPYAGSNVGRMVLEVDDMGDHFEGCAYAYDRNPSLPSTFAIIKTSDKANRLKLKAPLLPLHPQTGEPTEWQQVVGLYSNQDIKVPKEAEVACEWDDQHIALRWRTDIETFGSADLPKGEAAQTSTLQPLPVTSWQGFKEYVTGLELYRHMFRGQTNTWRLRTPFHRTGRGDMRRFLMVDIPTLHKHLSARTRHVFDLTNPIQNAAFLHLVQHHGYPTPLLDWTYSPFVAAYFAYQRVRSSEAASASEDQKVRIFVFDKVQWCVDLPQISNLSTRWEHFSIVEPVAIANERLIPQQALSSFTTVDDIETYIRTKETAEKRYLQVIDLALRERDHVIRELRMMGITAGSLFPGLDGACEELKDRFFRS